MKWKLAILALVVILLFGCDPTNGGSLLVFQNRSPHTVSVEVCWWGDGEDDFSIPPGRDHSVEVKPFIPYQVWWVGADSMTEDMPGVYTFR
jgi:hypothetical protein